MQSPLAKVLRGSSLDPEVFRRAEVFQKQLRATGPFSGLGVLRGQECEEGNCLSCGAPLEETTNPFRCPTCQIAIWLALDVQPDEIGLSRKMGLTVREAARTAKISNYKARRTLGELFEQGKVSRFGRGVKGDPFRFCLSH